MKEFARYVGVLVMFIGVIIMVINFNNGTTSNPNLIVGLLFVIEGVLGHIFINNMKKGSTLSNVIWAIFLLIIPYFIFLLCKKAAYPDKKDVATTNE